MKQSTITKLLPVAIVGLVLGALYSSLTVTAQEAGSFNTKIYFTDNGNKLVVNPDGILQFVPYVPTMAATPAAGTNMFKLGLNVVPTAAANTAALLPTPSAVGEEAVIMSAAGNTVRIKPGGTNTINGGSAGAYLPIVTAGKTTCQASTLTAWSCNPDVQPTPQGP